MKKWKFDLEQPQRLQLKIFICLLGALLLLFLLLGSLLKLLIRQEETPDAEPIHIPVIQAFPNVWIMEADQEKIMIFRDGAEEVYRFSENPQEITLTYVNEDRSISRRESLREKIADIELTDGLVTEVRIKDEKINARLLGTDGDSVMLEGYGEITLSPDVKGYRIHDELKMCTQYDLPFGYDFADYVLEDGKICGILWAKEEVMEYIRVLLKTSDYGGVFHQKIALTADCDILITYGAYDNLQTEQIPSGTEVVLEEDSPYFTGERVVITPMVLTGKISLQNVNRSQGIPAYRGQLELLCTEDGIVLLNQVLLEEYLYSVVPSEMPSTYPEEALQAQAICARTYAYGHMLRAGYPKYGAHVDDSTSYQVYNNILEQESTTTAVKKTYGQLLYTKDNAPAGTYYYSTSCGVGSDANVWKTEAAKEIDYLRARAINLREMERADETNTVSEDASVVESLREESTFGEFISSVDPEDFEAKEPWYRWQYRVEEIDKEQMLAALQKRYRENPQLILTLKDGVYLSHPIEELSQIREIRVESRGAGGVAEELVIKTKKNTYKVISEYNVRYILKNSESSILRQDGSEVASLSLLPSGFFVMETVSEGNTVQGYYLVGGGFGHGAGMSQNAAKNMALQGFTAIEILLFFYENCVIRNVYMP